MKQTSFPRTKCHVSCGSTASETPTRPARSIAKHNICHRMQILGPTKHLETLETQLQALTVANFTIQIPNLGVLLTPVFLALVENHQLNCVSKGQVDHQDVFMLGTKSGSTAVRMVLNLTELSYQQGGLVGKRSLLLRGTLKQRLYQVMFADLRPATSTDQHQRSKLLWSAERLFSNTTVTITMNTAAAAPVAAVQAYLSQFGAAPPRLITPLTQTFCDMDTPRTLSHTDYLEQCPLPSPALITDHLETFTADLLEWATYASIGGQQLFQAVLPYISSYAVDEHGDEPPLKTNLSCLTWDGLVATDYLAQKLHQLQLEMPWSCVFAYGLPDTPVSFGLLEHGFLENGENDIVVLVSGKAFTLWEIVGGRDGS